ncbi:MAG: hypothetical protein U0836_22565 [Pirellulales bacterium]
MRRWILPVALLLAACLAYRATLRAGSSAPAPRRELPWRVAPRYDDPRVATTEQLAAVMDRMKPRAKPFNTNVALHALRLWGPHAEFDSSDYLSGPQMLGAFLDDREFRKLAGPDAAPLYSEVDEQILVRPAVPWDASFDSGAAHTDDVLATLAESGVPLDHPLVLRDRTGTVRELLDTAIRRFHDQQFEYEWTAISYARYLYPLASWQNRFGQTIDVDALIDETIEAPWRDGVCAGTHRLEALAVLARVDEQGHALAPRERRKVLEHLGSVSHVLAQSQHPAGYWTGRWWDPQDAQNSRTPTNFEKILATGHHLEWLAFAPEEVQPPREVIVRAAQWLVQAMLEIDEKTLQEMYGPFSHAARALCLWRSRDPFEAWRAGQPSAVTTEARRHGEELKAAPFGSAAPQASGSIQAETSRAE